MNQCQRSLSSTSSEVLKLSLIHILLGITTLQMGVFGGIVVGLGVAALHNKFYKIELPQVLAFFGGTRFVDVYKRQGLCRSTAGGVSPLSLYNSARCNKIRFSPVSVLLP